MCNLMFLIFTLHALTGDLESFRFESIIWCINNPIYVNNFKWNQEYFEIVSQQYEEMK